MITQAAAADAKPTRDLRVSGFLNLPRVSVIPVIPATEESSELASGTRDEILSKPDILSKPSEEAPHAEILASKDITTSSDGVICSLML